MYQALYDSSSMQDYIPPKKGLGYPVNAPEWWPKPPSINPAVEVKKEGMKKDFEESYEKWLHSRTRETVIDPPVEEYTPGQIVIVQDTTRMLIMNIHAPSAEAFYEMNPGQQKACVEEFIGVKAAFFFGSRMHRAGQVPVSAGDGQQKYSGRVYSITETSETVLGNGDVTALTSDISKIPAAANDDEIKKNFCRYDDVADLAKARAELKLCQEAELSPVDGDNELPPVEKNTPPHVPLSIALLFQDMMNSCGGFSLMDDVLDRDFRAFIAAHNEPTWGEASHRKRLVIVQNIIDQLRNLKRKNRELGKKCERDSDPRKLAATLDVQLAKILEEMNRQKKMNLIWPSPMIVATAEAPKEGEEAARDGALKKKKVKKQGNLGENGVKEPKKGIKKKLIKKHDTVGGGTEKETECLSENEEFGVLLKGLENK